MTAPSPRRYKGDRLLVAFFATMILVLIVGMTFTWTVGKAIAPGLKERRLKERVREAETDRQKGLLEDDVARENKGATPQPPATNSS